MMKMRKRHRGGWIFITLKTNTMKNRCKGNAFHVIQHNFSGIFFSNLTLFNGLSLILRILLLFLIAFSVKSFFQLS